jgi:uncharacterized protein (TIGR02231 family)
MADSMDVNDSLDAPITGVTVFRDGARVTRSGQGIIPAGLAPLVLARLPVAADPESVRVAVRGQDVALLEVEANLRHGVDPVRAETARLRAEAERSADAVQALEDEDAAEQARLGFAAHLSEAAAVAMARAVSFGRAGQDDLARMGDFLTSSTAAGLERRRDISARRRAAARELEAAEQRLAVAEKRGGSPQYVEVAATVEAAAEARAEIELSYHVKGASWRPLYDLSLTGERLAASYLAEVTQRTGEDWPAVRLVLSTSRRGEHRALPELQPWYIRRREPEPRRGLVGFASRMAASSGAPGEAAGVPLAAQGLVATRGTQPAAPLTAEVAESGVSQVYSVARPLAVPADGNPHKTAIAQLELDANLDYLAVPVLAPEAYLRATVINTSGLLLLSGNARIYRDGQFAGDTSLETVAPGEEFELQLGVDDQIRIERKLRRRATSKAVIGAGRTVDVGYETTVRNHRPVTAKISVHDHIPVSTDAEIKVRLREATPRPVGQTDLGELTWELALDAGQAATITHRFTVEHSGEAAIVGLQAGAIER